jgi:hypothetical protein
VPAAAVIPALIAYIKVVVVKTPVVDFSTVEYGSSKESNYHFESEFEFSAGALY